MATTEYETSKIEENKSPSPENGSIARVAEALAKVDIQEDKPPALSEENAIRPLHVYTRSQVLLLSKSPLVQSPQGMPLLKDWFGDWNEQQVSAKKETETSTTSANPRDRRFRRDPEDGDAPARPSFRAALSQPSQMGNFRHQSLRTTERERDTDRERQRDERDREGQERLRNLSDKYDRERLAQSSSPQTLRNKEREPAPHLASSAARKKPGESSDDWRRGSEPSRAARDDRSDNARRDRDRDRDRPRDSSRPRRETSTTRQDREDRDRDRPRRGDDRDDVRRDRDDYTRRDRDDYFRRDRDDSPRDRDDRERDRFEYSRPKDTNADEDSRRWRDDGKRDERITARRERERDNGRWDRWEPSHDRERVDDRDPRSKRPTGREKRVGGADDGREKDDRKEREREKEPAWMETYIPTTPTEGILGARTDGELDGIQAWKRGMKEKERKEKGETPESTKNDSEPPVTPSDNPLDEIQLFKLMMKAAKKEPDQGQTSKPTSMSSTPLPAEPRPLPISKESSQPTTITLDSLTIPSNRAKDASALSPQTVSPSPNVSAPSSESARLFSLIGTSTGDTVSSRPMKPTTPLVSDHVPPAVSRMFPNPPGLSPSIPQMDRSTFDLSGPAPTVTPTLNPPAGSRLLAFGSRNIAGSGSSSVAPPKSLTPMEALHDNFSNHMAPGVPPHHNKLSVMTPGMGMNVGLHQGPDSVPSSGVEAQFGTNPRATPSDRSARSFSPFGQPSHAAYAADDIHEAMRLAQASEALRRQPVNQLERGSIGPGGDSPYIDLGRASPGFSVNGPGYDMAGTSMHGGGSIGKGSRFAKFFDAKNRDAQAGPTMRKAMGGPGFISTSPVPGQRPDVMVSNPLNADNRAMEDLFAMLQNSSQNHRASPQINQTGRMSAGGGGPFGHSPIDLQALQQHQQMQQQQFAHNARMDSLYDSRLDDRNFVPDGMVPGLRPTPRPRSREPTTLAFNDQLDDALHVNVQRHPQQQRSLEQMYSGAAPSLYNQQVAMARNGGIPLQQAQFRGGLNVIPPQNTLQGPSQRLPPGLANLGGRPPHDPTQYLNQHLGGLGGVHGGLHPNPPAQQSYNNFNGGGLGFNGNPGPRGPIPVPHQNQITANHLAALGHGNSMDPRGTNQLVGMNVGGLGAGGLGGLRNVSGGFNPQHGPTSHIQAPQMAIRQQQQQQQQQHQQHLPPHIISHALPHLQPQQLGGSSQGAQDLMALLMGGHRE
ncbi:hypothetical protein PHLCEN_2v11742 [Hermanssonia centrifuga]|uniref:Uncharacterized protein n=1 Tax=Hermanssonia centrifuga TaxID=98765 RepID=A0A2R6NJ53_9APHY|nr:hypothetical protein PHLCEN_2v11742 [Hermanssonia centrifuga]